VSKRLRIGLSACFFHKDPKRALFKGKTLLYVEQSMTQWVMSAGAIPVLMPQASGELHVQDLVEDIDGLVLQGGSDMSPTHYGETPQRPEWEGDYVRDLYEMELVRACMEQNKPVLGACRGLQVINVTLGGSLWQDIQTQHPKRQVHRNWEVYDQLFHDIEVKSDSWLSDVAGGARVARVNSVHHQGIKVLGQGLVAEAHALADGMVEAVRYTGGGEQGPFVYGVQWHPEFMDPADEKLLSPTRLFGAFVEEVRARRRA
jgi:putative glutamine amidotransferase